VASISTDLAQKILRSIFLGVPMVRATTGYITLYKDDDPPDRDGDGGTEIGAGHVPETVSFNGATWSVSGLTATNIGTMTGNANGTSEVTATHYGIWDSSDNLMFTDALNSPVVITSGAPFQIAAGAIDFTIGGNLTTAFANDILDHVLTGASITWPTSSVKIDLVSTAPSAGSAGTSLTGTAYIKLTVLTDTDHWSLSERTVSNAADMDFGSAGSDWTDPAGHNIYSTDGTTRLIWANYGGSLPVTTDNVVIWKAGYFSVLLD
jgi:hypothetical protein